MAHETLDINFTREWTEAQAKVEPESGITSVGGLAHRIGELEQVGNPARPAGTETLSVPATSADPKRQSLGKFIELSRRRMRLSVEQLADKANVDLAELLAIEKAEDILPEPRTVYQLAQILRMRVEPLMELAGLVVPKSIALTESAVRFAARSEPMDALTKEEEEALNWFVKELSK
jgi:HTH-type transcriptional regulator, competence development regulator